MEKHDSGIYVNNMAPLADNPMLIRREAIRMLREVKGGTYGSVTANSPLAFLLEAGASMSTSSLTKMETLQRRSNASQARTLNDLYYSMSDDDIAIMFAEPASFKLPVFIDYVEILNKAVVSEPGVKKVIIPADTLISADTLNMGLMYPIEIRVYENGSLRIISDVSKENPAHGPMSPDIEWYFVNLPLQGGEMMRMVELQVPVKQMTSSVYHETLSNTKSFKRSYPTSDQICGVFAHRYNSVTKEWVEIPISFNQSYVTSDLALVGKLSGTSVTLEMPKIFFTREMTPSQIRVIVQTTKGEINVSMERFHPDAFKFDWRDFDGEGNQYVTAMRNINNVRVYSSEVIKGGRSRPSDDVVKSRVINNSATKRHKPITENQLRSKNIRNGFSIKMEEDNAFGRTYSASTNLPAKGDIVESFANGASINSPIGTMLAEFETSVISAEDNPLVFKHGDSLTLCSGLVLVRNQGVLSILSNGDLTSIKRMNNADVIKRVAEKEYLMNPFTYVIRTGDVPSVDVYHLDSPVLKSREFVAENPHTPYEVKTASVGISKDSSSYRITVQTALNKAALSEGEGRLHAQLSIVTPDHHAPHFSMGVIIGRDKNEFPIFEFTLPTSFKLNEDSIELGGLTRWDTAESNRNVGLDSTFTLSYFISSEDTFSKTSIDISRDADRLPSNAIGVKQEYLKISLGKRIKEFWSPIRASVKGAVYQTYTSDVDAQWEEPVYKMDVETDLPEITIASDGSFQTTIIHSVGDHKEDPSTGLPEIKHRKNTVIRDNEMRPLLEEPRKRMYIFEMVLVDGVYAFTNDDDDKKHLKESINYLSSWSDRSLNDIRDQLIGNTRLLAKPFSTIGDAIGTDNELTNRNVRLEQSLKMVIGVNASTNKDDNAKEKIKQEAFNIINRHLAENKVGDTESYLSATAIAKDIREGTGAGVIDVDIKGLGGERNLDRLTISDRSSTFSIKKILMISKEGSVAVRDDISIQWVERKM